VTKEAPGGVTPARLPGLGALTDPERVRAVERVVGQGPVGPRLDRLVRHAARRLSASRAQVSLLAEHDLVVAAAHGVEVTGAGSGSLADSLCTLTAASGSVLVVPMAPTHPWVRDLPPVTSGQVGAYLGVVLRDRDGLVLGSLSVFDVQPRAWTAEQVAELSELAELVAAELDDHLHRMSQEAGIRASVAVEAAELGSFAYSFAGPGGLDWDQRMMTLHGFTAETFDGTFAAWQSCVHPEDLPVVLRELDVARSAVGGVLSEYRVVTGGGTSRWVRIRGRVLPDMRGRPSHVIGAAYDASSQHGLRDELVRLTETMPTALVRIARDWSFSYVNGLAESLYGRTREQLVGINIYEAFPEVRGSEFDLAYVHAMATGEPRTVEAYFEPLDMTFEVRVWPDDQGLTLFFHDVSARVRAQAALTRAGARLQVLADAGARLARAVEPQEVLDVLTDVVVPGLAESLVVVVTGPVAEQLGAAVDADPERLYPVRVTHRDPTTERELTEVITATDLRTSQEGGLGTVVRTGQPRQFPRVPDDVLRSRASTPALYEQMVRLNDGQRTAVPLTAPGAVLGALSVSAQDADPLDDVLLLDLATRAAVALENALSYARQHQAATVLQRALLPSEPPVVPGVEVATRYLPASAYALAGGDFFKTVDVDGVLVCALGDVMGHGTESAARAGQLHGLVAALALQGLGPGALLARLAGGIGQMMDLQLATLLICSYDPGTRTLTTATAGHPPPLVAGPQASARYVDVEPGPPIGVATGAYPESSSVLAAGTSVLMFSDGLIERRDESLTLGLERLRRAVDGQELTPTQLCRHALRSMHAEAGGSDDIALLALRHD
jgi:PAS domain S-box-containing protein